MHGGHAPHARIPALVDSEASYWKGGAPYDDGAFVILCPWTFMVTAHPADPNWTQCEWKMFQTTEILAVGCHHNII